MGSDSKRKRRESSRSPSPDERKRGKGFGFAKVKTKTADKFRRSRYRSDSNNSSTDSDRSPNRKKTINKPKPKKKGPRSPTPEKSKRKRHRSRSESGSSSSSRSRTPDQKKKANPSGDSDKEDKTKKKKKRGRSSSKSRSRSRSKSPEKRKDKDRSKDRPKERDRYDRDRDRNRDRDRDRDRERDRDRDRDRDRYKERDKREKTSSKENGKESKESKSDSKSKSEKSSKQEKNKATDDLDDIEGKVKKRKERIEQWRAARRKDAGETSEEVSAATLQEGKKWSLEDDETDEEEVVEEQAEEQMEEDKKEEEQIDEELDPLDAYMKEVQKDVKKLHSFGQQASTAAKGKTTTIVKTVVTKSNTAKQIKPEVIEQNQDLMEYSSEEEKEDNLEGAFDKLKKKKKKELLAADHNKIYYAPFRKKFYVEVPELARMTVEEVAAINEEFDVQARGKGVPKPLKTWAQSGVNMKHLDVLKRCNYEKPTPIQAQGIPTVMSGRDVIGIAKTGSGKTLAFLLPMFRHILDQPPLDSDDGPIAIIMTPTRELALQIWKECRKFCKPVGLQAACIYGGSGISEQVAELKRGAEIIVCTPGRMIDMLTANNGRVTNCRRCTYLVLDEADRMFDMGFEPQVTKIIDNIRPDRQTVMFSATFPRQMEALARKLLTKPIEIQVGGRSVVCSDVTQHAIVIEEDNKFLKLLELLGVYQERGGVLVFTEKQDDADKLFKDLLKRGYPCLSLHGGMDQFDRDSTIADFKNGVTKLMVATSVAARGLDVKNLILVVNYDCPNHYEDYVHRCGRTGRAGNKGTAFTFVTPEQGKFGGDVVKAMEMSGVTPPDDLLGLWELYKEEMKSEGKELKRNSGFSGKGFKFDDEELVKSNEMKKMQKWSLGMQDSDDEAEAAENAMDKIEEDLEKAFGSKPKKAPPQVAPTAQPVGVTVAKDKLDMASIIAAKINIKISQGHSRDRTQQATSKVLQGGSLEQITGIGLAKQLADKVNAKLNYKAPEPEKEEQTEPEEKLQKYEEEIEVNDFPQQARWRITSKETISQVGEISEAGITVRGSYIPPGKQPAEGEKKLHLYIESLSERSIQTAKAEVRRLLKEELIKYESSTYRPQQPGRYKVV